MIICVWCKGAIADDEQAAATPGICEGCLPPIHERLVEANARAAARMAARSRHAHEVATVA